MAGLHRVMTDNAGCGQWLPWYHLKNAVPLAHNNDANAPFEEHQPPGPLSPETYPKPCHVIKKAISLAYLYLLLNAAYLLSNCIAVLTCRGPDQYILPVVVLPLLSRQRLLTPSHLPFLYLPTLTFL